MEKKLSLFLVKIEIDVWSQMRLMEYCKSLLHTWSHSSNNAAMDAPEVKNIENVENMGMLATGLWPTCLTLETAQKKNDMTEICS